METFRVKLLYLWSLRPISWNHSILAFDLNLTWILILTSIPKFRLCVRCISSKAYEGCVARLAATIGSGDIEEHAIPPPPPPVTSVRLRTQSIPGLATKPLNIITVGLTCWKPKTEGTRKWSTLSRTHQKQGKTLTHSSHTIGKIDGEMMGFEFAYTPTCSMSSTVAYSVLLART